MKLKVLGSGSKGNCYLLQGKNETLILECGIRYKDILKGLNFNLRNVVGCLMSHEHKDHSKSVKDLIKNGLTIYTSLGTSQEIGVDDFTINSYRLDILKSEEIKRIGDFIVLPFKTEHDAAEPLGFLIKHEEMGKLLFITDSYYCQYKFTELNHILIECNYSENILEENLGKGFIPRSLKNRLLKSHFSLDNATDFLRATDLVDTKEIVLIHLSDGNSNAVKFKEEIEKATAKPTYIADNGLELELRK